MACQRATGGSGFRTRTPSSVARLCVPFDLRPRAHGALTNYLADLVLQLPYWWFAKILLNILMTDAESFQAAATAGQSPPVFQRGVDQFQRKGIVFREILESARIFVSEKRLSL